VVVKNNAWQTTKMSIRRDLVQKFSPLRGGGGGFIIVGPASIVLAGLDFLLATNKIETKTMTAPRGCEPKRQKSPGYS
jgi:hypothetical protein